MQEDKLRDNRSGHINKQGYRTPKIAISIALSLGLWGGTLSTASAAENVPQIEDQLSLLAQISGKNCAATADVGLYEKQSAVFEVEVPGAPVAAYIVWSGRDRENRGDDVILINGQPIVADMQEHGESGGGSWWHTYTHDVSDLVSSLVPEGGLLNVTLSGLTIGNNLGGENHGAGLIVLYASDQCDETDILLFSGLDSFKRTAPAAIYGPHSAVHCATVNPSQESRQIDLQLQLGGIEGAERNATIWLLTSAETTPPATLIDRADALSFLDPVGNDPSKRQWDRFLASIELPSERTQACIQIESGEPEGVSAVLVTFMAQVHGAGMTGGGTNSIAGTVWHDANQDGLPADDESGIPNIVVLLRDAAEKTIYQAFVTGESGQYKFSGLAEGMYTVDVAQELFTSEWLQTAEADDLLDTEVVVPITPDSAVDGIDFGFVPVLPTGQITGTVWTDANGSGTYETDIDSPLASVSVSLFDAEQTLIAENVTTDSGIFTFTELSFAGYTVQIGSNTLPADSVQTFETDGTFDGSVAISLTETAPSSSVSFGYGKSGYTSGMIWHDLNGDGIFSINEPGIDNVLLLLTDLQGVGRVAATQNGGQYQFDSLPIGTYVLRVVTESMRPGASPTFDPDGVLNAQTTFVIEANTILTNIDFGFEFGILGLEAASPQIDVTIEGIDLNDGDALLDYLMGQLEQADDSDSDDPLEEPVQPLPSDIGEDDIPTDPAEEEPGQNANPPVNEGNEPDINEEITDDAVTIHLPIIR